MAVLGSNPKSAEAKLNRSANAVLWLGATDPPLALVAHLRARGIVVATGTDANSPVARLMMVEAADSPAARNASIKKRRVAVIHPDPGSADALAQALRGRGADVVALSLDPRSLDRVEALDPDAVLMEATDFYGSCWEIVRALWQHPRLKYAPVLLAPPESAASYAQGTPDVPSLCLAVQSVSEVYEQVERSAKNADSFELELAQLGPAKLLRVLAESNRGFRVNLHGPQAEFEIDVAEGIIVGAQSSAGGAANDRYLGVHALALLMTQERGTVQVRVANRPAATNVMAPLDAALHAAREAKVALPSDATRASAPRKSIPSPASLGPIKKPLVGALAPKQPTLVEGARPSKWPEAKKPAPKSIPVAASNSSSEAEPEPVETSKLQTLPAPPLNAPALEQEQAAPTSLAGLAMAARDLRQDAPSMPSEPPTELRPLGIGAANPGADEASDRSDAQPEAFVGHAAPAVVEDGAQAALAMHRESRPEDERSLLEETTPEAGNAESTPALPRERLHVWAALGGLGAGFCLLGMLLFWRAGPQSIAAPASKPAVLAAAAAPNVAAAAAPNVAAAAAPNVEVTAAPAPPAGQADDPEGAPNQPALAAETNGGASDEEGSSSGLTTSKPPSRQASALVSRGHELRKRKQYAQAKARYQQALSLLPGYPRALAGLAQVSIAQDRAKEAVQFAQKLVAARPGQASYQLLLGDAYKAANMPKEAQQAWQSAARRGNSAALARLKSTTEALAAPAKSGIAATKPATAAKPASAR